MSNDKEQVLEAAEVQPAAKGMDSGVLKEMIEAGIFGGRSKSKTHPRMRPFVLTNRNGIGIINLDKTAESLEKAVEFLKDKVQNGGKIVFVATQPAARSIVAEVAQKHGFYYVSNRWLGGTFTNFKTISQRIDYFKKLKADKASGALEKYTKKERVNFDREIERLEKNLGGIADMTGIPDVLFVVNPTLHDIAIQEARRSKVPVIAIVNIDANPDLINYPIIANDNSKSSVTWIMSKIDEAISESKKGTRSLPVKS